VIARARSIAFALALVACKPDLGPPDSHIGATRVLAVKAEPPEVKPGGTVIFRALVASPGGTIAEAPLVWSFCRAPKPITENNIVSAACLGWLDPFYGPSPAAAGVTPSDACALFGPDAPPGGFRPRDPDVTGGYFQPVRVNLDRAESFALERVTCNLANTSADNARDFGQRYKANQNPTLAAVTASNDGAPIALDAIPAGSTVTLRAAWGAGDAESYVRLDPSTQRIEEHREWLRVSWFASDGAFADDRTGRAEDEVDAWSENRWTAPVVAGAVPMWVVLRDSRGGVDFASLELRIVTRE
jgi:hypothetical protein